MAGSNPSVAEKQNIPLWRKCLYITIAWLFVLLLAEAAGRALMYFRYGPPNAPGESVSAVEYDPLLGWRNVPQMHIANRFGPGEHLSHNSRGFRATEEYGLEIPAGRYRIICLGDSFTYSATGDDETYPSQLQSLCPNIQTINMGTGAYGIDQAYLKYKRDAMGFKANMLLFAFIEDDFNRMLLPTFRTSVPKPQITLEGESLIVSNVPVPQWHTFPRSTALFQVLYKLYSEITNRYDVVPVAEHIFDELDELSRARNQRLVLVYLPTEWTDLMRPGRLTNRIAAHAREKGIPFLDLTAAFNALSSEERRTHFKPDGHYSGVGNRLAAEILLRDLRSFFPAEFAGCP